MIEQQGRVVSAAQGMAEIRLGGTTGCARCDAGRGCGAGVFGRLLKRRPVVVSLENTISARPGQAVVVGIPETLYLGLIVRLYLFPLLAGVAGAAFGHYLSGLGNLGAVGSDLTTLLCGLVSGLAVLSAAGSVTREFPGRFIVHLLRIVEDRETGK